jgi:nitroreductase
MDAIELLLSRVSNAKVGEPAPDDESLRLALRAAVRAPDHGMLRPWRIQVVRGSGREQLGLVMREALAKRDPSATADDLDKEQSKPLRAPLIIVLSARFKNSPKIPEIEQLLSAGIAANNVLLVLQARGYGGIWRTGSAAYDPQVKQALGIPASDAIIGFLYAGTPRGPSPRFERAAPDDHVEDWPTPTELS